MKSLLLVVMGLLLIGSVANANEISAEPATGPGTPANWVNERDDYALTQNADPSTFDAGGYSCGNVALGYTTEGWSMRRFSLAYEFDILDPFCVTSIDWGVRRFTALLDSIPGPYAVDVNLYTIPETDPILFANMTLIASESVPLTLADNPVPPAVGVAKTTLFNNVTVNPLGYDLIVAVHAPEGYSTTPTTRFAVAAHNTGQTLPPYYAFAGCGFPEPVTPVELNPAAPDAAQMVLVVNGHLCVTVPTGACCNTATGACDITTEADCAYSWLGIDIPCNIQTCPVPVPVEGKSWGQVKSLYR